MVRGFQPSPGSPLQVAGKTAAGSGRYGAGEGSRIGVLYVLIPAGASALQEQVEKGAQEMRACGHTRVGFLCARRTCSSWSAGDGRTQSQRSLP